MHQPTARPPGQPPRLQAGRVGLAASLFPFLHPTHADAAVANADSLTLRFASGKANVPFSDIEEVKVRHGWLWAAVRVRASSGERTLSGLAPRAARSFARALEEARVAWLRGILAANAELLHSVHSRVAELADPPRYMAMSVFSVLEREAREVAGRLPSRWPDGLSNTNESQMRGAIGRFLEDPAGARAGANAAFVAKELVSSRWYFDSVEAKPLTDEQRRAVVVDEDRNLVVAAAGSGKTSVIVAKAGWLLWKNYRRPSELLMLAFNRDAKGELEKRVRSRLGAETASDLAVQTFHSLGMSIIGAAEGKKPTLAWPTTRRPCQTSSSESSPA